MKKLVALIKAFKGGEWLDCCLNSIASVDGVVVVMSSKSWSGGEETNNCAPVISAWKEDRPKWITDRWCESANQEVQYADGLKAISEIYGDDAAVLIVDTDEIWNAKSLEILRAEIATNPNCHYFQGKLFTYLRSPLYQVYPMESATPVVALQNAKQQRIVGRFRSHSAGGAMVCDGVYFHHFSYVRCKESDIPSKFMATSSQEDDPSNAEWLENVWPRLPLGKNVHMSPGYENCWSEIKVLPHPQIPIPMWCESLIVHEEKHWKSLIETEDPNKTLIPTPNDSDAKKYPEFAFLAEDATLLRKRLKVSYLEALVLSRLAENVPDSGKVLEIGSGSGGSLAVMALATQAKLWAVDPFTLYNETTAFGTVKNVHEGNEAEFWETARHYGYANRVRHIKHNSDVAAEHCPDATFDIVFVDGNHTYEVVKNDLLLYWPKVKRGGIMIVHDYTTRFPGVIRAMKESGLEYSVFSGTSIAYAQKS